GSGSDAFCSSSDHVKAATNANTCFDGACTDVGDPVIGWPDPRRTPEPVIWDLPPDGSVSASGASSNTLTREADTTLPDAAFDAGAAGDPNQGIHSGAAY